MHLSTYRADGAYPAPGLTIASGLAHVCTAGNRRGFLSAAVHASRVAGTWQRITSWSARQERFNQLRGQPLFRMRPLARRILVEPGERPAAILVHSGPAKSSTTHESFLLASMQSARCYSTLIW